MYIVKEKDRAVNPPGEFYASSAVSKFLSKEANS
jgi:hypothetical protein